MGIHRVYTLQNSTAYKYTDSIWFSDDTAAKVDTLRTDVVYEQGIRYKVGGGELYTYTEIIIIIQHTML